MKSQGVRPMLRRWLGIWLLSRLVIVVVVTVGALAGGVDRELRATDPATWWLYRFAHWDSHLYAAIADRGYVAEGPASSYNAFFPGLPALMKAWTLVTGTDGRWGVLVVVTIAGAAAAVLLASLATDVTGRVNVGTWAVVLLATAPLTVFFSVAYTEALFLCLSVGAWLVARRGHWLVAGLLAGGACTLRLNGLFLVAGLMMLYVMRERSGWRVRVDMSAIALFIGPVLVACWAVWLHGLTGHWDAWTIAQERGWGRTAVMPLAGLGDGLSKLEGANSWHLLIARILDIAAIVIAIVATAYYLRRRDWPIATLLGLNAVPVLTSSILDSGGRYILVWFPIYVSIAEWVDRHPRWRYVIVGGSVGAALLLTYAWSQQYWIA